MARRSRKKQIRIEYGSLVGLIVFIVLIVFEILKNGKLGSFLAKLCTLIAGPWHLVLLLTGFFAFFYLSFLKDRYPLNAVVFIGLGVLNVAFMLLGSHLTLKGVPLSFKEIPGILRYDFSMLFKTAETLNAGLFDSLLYALLTGVSSGREPVVIIVALFVIALLLIVPFTAYQAIYVWAKLRKDRFFEIRREQRAERERQRELRRRLEEERLREEERLKKEKEAEERSRIIMSPEEKEQMMIEMNSSSDEEFDNEKLIQQMAAVPAEKPADIHVVTRDISEDEDISEFSRTYFYIDQNGDSYVIEKKDIPEEISILTETEPAEESQEEETIGENEEPVIAEEEKGEEAPKIVAIDKNKVNVKKGRYRKPPLTLLKSASNKASSVNKAAAEIKGQRLIEILANFGIQATLTETHIGPSVTKFEIKPDSSVKVSKIQNISDNIKMELSAKDVRIEAPVPGKNAVGIEIPNVENVMVRMSELMRNVPEKKKNSPLLFALGKDLMGESVFCELNKMPHLLIAGATGSGKSVCINTIICSYILRSDPNDVKLVLVDPKKVEFTPYHDIPHLLWPVITDPKMANLLLQRTVGIMEERYDVFSNAGVRNIQTYNELVEKHNESLEPDQAPMLKMPYIVVIIDELADLMMVAGKEVEMSIQRITQLARASGIHLIVATQRPSTDVITGIIKSNIPSRISFAVASSIDSRTILDQTGAERLLGNGDMLYYPQGENAPIRLQGAFVTDDEISDITGYAKEQAAPSYDDAYFEFLRNNSPGSSSSSSGGFAPNKKDDADAMYDEVVEYIRETQKVSTSLLQRKFGFGYNRAARLVDMLEEKGLIGPANGSKPREVYVKKEDSEQ